jgi:hypothetical protein
MQPIIGQQIEIEILNNTPIHYSVMHNHLN